MAGQRSPAPNNENDVNSGSNIKLIARPAFDASSETKTGRRNVEKRTGNAEAHAAHKPPAWIFPACRVSSALAADLRMSHLMSAQRGSAGSNRDPAKRAHRVHVLMDLALPEARKGPEKATSETGGVFLTLVTPDADKSDSH